jgi:thiosulfate/3-mercaptopyruvate sulfurtransferase
VSRPILDDQGVPQPAEVTVAWLLARLNDDPSLRLVDVSSHRIGRQPGYLPGAVLLDWEGAFGRSPSVRPSPLVLASVMSQLGIGDDHLVVLYDEGRGARSLPIHGWLLRFGHQRVFSLAGGRSEWVRRELRLVPEPAKHSAASFTVKIGNLLPQASNRSGRRRPGVRDSGRSVSPCGQDRMAFPP